MLIVTALPKSHFSYELYGKEGRKKGRRERKKERKEGRMGERNTTLTAEIAY